MCLLVSNKTTDFENNLFVVNLSLLYEGILINRVILTTKIMDLFLNIVFLELNVLSPAISTLFMFSKNYDFSNSTKKDVFAVREIHFDDILSFLEFDDGSMFHQCIHSAVKTHLDRT